MYFLSKIQFNKILTEMKEQFIQRPLSFFKKKKKKKKLAFPPEKTFIHLRGRSKMKNPPTRVTKQRWKPAVSAILPRYNEALAVYKGIRHDRIDRLWNTKQRRFVLYNIVFINLTSTMHLTRCYVYKNFKITRSILWIY